MITRGMKSRVRRLKGKVDAAEQVWQRHIQILRRNWNSLFVHNARGWSNIRCPECRECFLATDDSLNVTVREDNALAWPPRPLQGQVCGPCGVSMGLADAAPEWWRTPDLG